jgi:hypothetical protein
MGSSPGRPGMGSSADARAWIAGESKSVAPFFSYPGVAAWLGADGGGYAGPQGWRQAIGHRPARFTATVTRRWKLAELDAARRVTVSHRQAVSEGERRAHCGVLNLQAR